MKRNNRVWPFRRVTSWSRSGKGLGRLGEKLAVRSLRGEGWKILARNFRCPSGEADIIALEPAAHGLRSPETIVFVEVKTRATDDYVDPESAVDARKQRQLSRVAGYYLAHHDAGDRAVRFDVVAVVLGRDGRPRVRHVPNAFQGG